jgi:hypothetical protein
VHPGHCFQEDGIFKTSVASKYQGKDREGWNLEEQLQIKRLSTIHFVTPLILQRCLLL